MDFSARLIQLRRERNLTQQALVDTVNIHVNHIRRYEAGTAQPALDALVSLAKGLHLSLDSLVFNDHARDTDEDFRLRVEALKDFTPSERNVAGVLLDSLISQTHGQLLISQCAKLKRLIITEDVLC